MKQLKQYIVKYFSSFSFFYRYLKWKVFLAFFLSVLIGLLDGIGLTLFVPLLKAVSGQEQIQHDDIGRLQYVLDYIENLGLSLSLGNILILMLVFFSLKGLAFYLSQVYIIILQQRFIRKIRLKLIDLLNQIRFKHFISSDVGQIQNTMNGEIEKTAQGFRYYFQSFQYTVMVFVYMGFAFLVNVRFAVLVTIGGILTNFIYKFIYIRTKDTSRKLTRENNIFQGQLLQHISHYKYLRATGIIKDYAEKLKQTVHRIEKSRKKLGFLSSIADATREPLMVAVIALVIFIQIKYFKGTLGPILVSLLLFYRALMALANMQRYWNRFLEVSGSLENMQDFEKDLLHHQEKEGQVAFQRFENKILLKNISFGYDNLPVLEDINLQISKNETVAFVGESGSGKTTLVNLIAGLLPPSGGELLIDNTAVSVLNKTSLQRRIGYVSQDPVIFSDTVYNNIAFWAPPTSENLALFQRCIRQAALDEFLSGLPGGQNTLLGHNGINLSGGQKQRVSIARELFKDIDILILDEATSALDSETERLIQESIESIKGAYTLLIVAHRLSTIKNADKIVFMDKGKIAATGSFDELLKTQSRFRTLAELQEL